MKVKLSRKFFGPNGHLYRPGEDGTVEIPEKLRDFLPKKGAEVIEVTKVADPEEVKAAPEKEPEPEKKADDKTPVGKTKVNP